MQIDRAFLLLGLLVLAAVQACVGLGGLDQSTVDAYPPEIQKSYRVFERKCSRCHTLARPLNANVNDVEHWKLYVERMRRQPGSGISPADAEEILVFLEYYTTHREGAVQVGTATRAEGAQ